ncbi:WD repeat-containing protein 6 [Coemansia interrupta]|uniref:WD repeat-containing protein 6 n=1 Tax=Coemansia interrupta TaxID=1126814 RepID=A0A9W8LDB9_9FUNG|nr:WD repeat-containing protein 6 [Coemansia interrupta]
MASLLTLRLNHLPITAVEFITDAVVLVGSGCSLIAYDTQTRTKVGTLAALSYARIHGITCLEPNQPTDNTHHAVVFGSKAWSVVDIGVSAGGELSMELVHRYAARDWIKSAHWVYDQGRDCWMVALALAHNRVVVCDPASGAVVYSAQCAEHCILYAAAFFGATLETLVMASGTVFNQVLLWHPLLESGDSDHCTDSPVTSRLCAHDGVVFGVHFSRDGALLASVSDDRTLRLWDTRAAGDSQPLATLFGHQARVWKCLVLREYLVSASEDGTCRVWQREGGEAVNSWRQGRKNVWALAANRSESLVVSGAADGSICVWALDAMAGRRVGSTDSLAAWNVPPEATYLPEGVAPRAAEHIRSFAMGPSASSDDMLAIMDSGCVLRRRSAPDLDQGSWRLEFYMAELAGYSMACSTLDGQVTAVGMRDGSVLVLVGSEDGVPMIRQIKHVHAASVSHLAFSSESALAYDLITMDADRRVIWSRISLSGPFAWTVLAEFRLPGRTRMATAAVSPRAGWLAVGSQNGGLYVFDLPASLRHPADSSAEVPVLDLAAHWPKIHGEYEVTSVVFETWKPGFAVASMDGGSGPNKCTLLTGARDGMMLRFALGTWRPLADTGAGSTEHERLGVLANTCAAPDSAPRVAYIERLASERLTPGSLCRLLHLGSRLYAMTYRRNRLVLLDVSSGTELFSHAFAETDRRWRLRYTGGGSVLVGLMNKLEVLHRHAPLHDESTCYRLAEGISSLDIRAADSICVPEMGCGGVLVAVAGEDGVLRLLVYGGGLRPVAQARRHTSVIRCVRFLSPVGGQEGRFRFLVTAGAGCELRCWRVDTEDAVSVLEWAVAPCFANDTEARIMDLVIVDQEIEAQTGHPVVLIATAASDASVRLWRLDLARHEFVCIAQDAQHVHNSCVLSLSAFRMGCSADSGQGQSFLASGATDGRLVFWDIARHVAEYCAATEDLRAAPVDIGPPAIIINDIHQSGVNSFDVQVVDGMRVLVASGGDDNALAVCELERDANLGVLVLRGQVRRCESAHASSVQQVVFTGPNTVCTVATDQRLARWNIGVNALDDDTSGIAMVDMAFTQVADPSVMVMLPKDPCTGNACLLVVGIGVEIFDI